MNSFRVCVVGGTAVGKSPLIVRFITGEFDDGFDSYVKDEFKHQFSFEEKQYTLHILDTTGIERNRKMRDEFLRSGEGFLLVYSIVDKKSFVDLENFRKQILDVKKCSRFPLVLVGNKSDLKNERKVSEEEGRKRALEWKIPFFEVSALKNIRVLDAFKELIKEVCKYKKRFKDEVENLLNNRLKIHQERNREIILECIKRKGSLLPFLNRQFQSDKEITLSAIENDSKMYEKIPLSLRNDQDFFIKSIIRNVNVIKHTNRWKKDSRVQRVLMREYGVNEVTLEYVLCIAGYQTVLNEVKKDGMLLNFVSHEFRNDKSIVLAAVKQNGKPSNLLLLN